MMKKTITSLVVLAFIISIVGLTPIFSYGQGDAAKDGIISVFGVKEINGEKLYAHITAVVPAGENKHEIADAVLKEHGARGLTKEEYSTSGLVWDQFRDANLLNDFVSQYYNPAGDPTSGNAEGALTNTHTTWTDVPSSSFAFSYKGRTTRCPSLVAECRGPQYFDGYNDVAWLKLNSRYTLGVTWYSTSRDEADMALNKKFSWYTDGIRNYDVETVLLHENGHVAGLGHSNVVEAVMYAYYQGIMRVLHLDDINGISALYPSL